MSFQSGVVYRDNRPISGDEAAIFLNSMADGYDGVPGTWCSGGVFLAHSGDEVQPIITGPASITFDGRLDNREELKHLLRDGFCGPVSDAALALGVFLRFGADGLRRLIGDWSLAIWHAEKKQLVLASDFAGVRPLYYYLDAHRIGWSTLLKALVAWIRPDGIDDHYVADFLTHGGYPDLTPYPGIQSVRPGHSLTYSNGRTELRAFWRLPTGVMVRYQRESDYEQRFMELFGDAVRVRLDADSTVMSELSGGLDSSSVVCMAKSLFQSGSVNPRRFVTLSYERPGSLDTRFYTAVEKWTGFDRVHFPITDQLFVSESDPGDTLPVFWSPLHAKVAAEARRVGARTLLTGSLGDLVGGNWQDDSAQIAGLFRDGEIRAALRQSLAWSMALRTPVWGILWRALLLFLPASAIRSRSDLFSDVADPATGREDSITPAFRARVNLAGRQRSSETWTAARPERMKHFRGLIEMLELRRLQPPERLAHLDYTHPFAHRPLVEYMLSIPAGIVCGPGEPRRLMRRAFHTLLPPALNGRRSKDSFGGTFLAALHPLVPGLMKEVKQLQVVERGYVDPDNLNSRLERLAHSLDNNAAQLRRLILLELWLQRPHQSASRCKNLPEWRSDDSRITRCAPSI